MNSDDLHSQISLIKIDIISMKKLQNLTQNIQRWNMVGDKALPLLEIVIVSNSAKQDDLKGILTDFQCTQAHNSEENFQTYIMQNGVIGKIHIVQGLTDKQIQDDEFRTRRAILQKIRTWKQCLYVLFSVEEESYLRKNQEHLHVFGLKNQYLQRNIIFQGSRERMYHQVLLKYEGLFKYELVNSFRVMKQIRKQTQKKTKKFIEWKDVLEEKVDPVSFSLKSFKDYTDAMKCSFRGIYLSTSFVIQSINWKIMELLQELWGQEGEALLKEIDHLPLSYIEEQYKMSDYYSIGGFLSDTCFKSIFSPPLYRFKDSIMRALGTVKYLVLNHVEAGIVYTFQNTSICDEFLSKQVEKIERLCDNFLQNFQKTLESQIQFLHADGEDFWNFRQLNSSFYAPDQQVYIQIKYIGKAYVRKVYESLKESVPRFVGQNLLIEAVKYFTEESLNTFIETTRQIPFKIEIQPYDYKNLEKNFNNLKEIDSLISFFSLRVNSSFLIKNFHEKKQKQWRRMFGEKEEKMIEENKEMQNQEEDKGIFAWMKRKILGKNRQNRGRVRVRSAEKKQKIRQQNVEEDRKVKTKKKAIDQKHWLLIINTGKEVNHEKLQQSACEGFPIRFRSSIWMYLATNHSNYKKIKVDQILKREDEVNQMVVQQIDKDVLRTPPHNLFRKSLKQILTKVLVAYSLHDKEVGYTQGMNFIAGTIILVLIGYGRKDPLLDDRKMNEDEVIDKAFCIMKYFMEQVNMRKLMFVNMELMTDLFIRIDDKIKELSPKMWDIIHQSGFSCEMLFASPLLSCLTTSQINYNLQLRVMDMVISTDFIIIYKIIAQFVANAQVKIGSISQDNFYDFLRNKIYDQIYDAIGDDGLTTLFKAI